MYDNGSLGASGGTLAMTGMAASANLLLGLAVALVMTGMALYFMGRRRPLTREY